MLAQYDLGRRGSKGQNKEQDSNKNMDKRMHFPLYNEFTTITRLIIAHNE